MASPRVVLRQRKTRRASVLPRSRSIENAPINSSVDAAPRSNINTHWLRSSTRSQGNGSKDDENSLLGKKRKLDDGPELPLSGTSKRSAPVREQRHKPPSCSPSSPTATSCRKTRSSVITSGRRESLRSRTASSLTPLRKEPGSGRPRSSHRTSDHTLEEKVTGLRKEADRLQEVVVKTTQRAEILTKKLVSFEKINRQQGAQIDKLKCANKRIGDKLSLIRENLQCQICLELLLLPHALDPCGHVFCQKCLQDWFRSAPHRDDDEDNVERPPAILRNQTCPCCRSRVRNRPIPLFALKNVLSAFASNVQTFNESGPDPWKDIFVSDLDFSESGGSELSETEFGTDNNDGDTDSDTDGLRTFRGSESEDTDEESGTDGDWTSSDDSNYVSDMQTPPWAPARFRHEMTREMFPDICSQHFRLLQRGVLPQMVERFSIRYDEDEGIVAWTPHGAEVYLGWNIRLPVDDFIDGRLFISWVERDIHEEPENWLHDVSEDHPVYRRLVPRWQRHELLTPEV